MKRFASMLLVTLAAACGQSPGSELPPIAGLGVALSGAPCACSQDIPQSIVDAVAAQFDDALAVPEFYNPVEVWSPEASTRWSAMMAG